jgi:crotonobetainyl-CoA:carnitine CoA-transferase CaiB-like acyl-CoA transferase
MGRLPLAGIRIVDLTHSWAGPHATRVLADFGAEVIRVEYLRRLCLLRGARKENQTYNKHPGWFQVNRNKLSLTLDLQEAKDRAILQDLVKNSDVFTENARTGVMEKLGFDYRQLRELKPDIIMVSMAAFGNSGPYAAYAGYGATVENISGIQSLTAYGRNGKPQRIKEMDIINGIVAAGAIMTALLYRQVTGRGQHVDFSHMEASTHALIGEHLLEYAMNGSQTLPLGNRHGTFAPQGCYRCKGADEWVALTVRSDEEWQRFCEALGHRELHKDPRFASQEARRKNHDAIDRLIEAWTAGHGNMEAMEILQGFGVPAGAVLNVAQLSQDRHLAERGYFFQEVLGSDRPFMGTPFKLSQGSGKVLWRGPDLGAHNKSVLCGLLGFSPDEIKPIDQSEIGTAYDPE